MFYQFHQNNSGGHFDYDYERGISCNVIVEADDPEEANYRAKRIGLYFDGYGDCSCCGDRWSEFYWGEGDDTPMVYNKPAVLETAYGWRDCIDWEGFIHFKDGRKVGFAHESREPGLEVKEPFKGLAQSLKAIGKA